jgi:hypothetical protein
MNFQSEILNDKNILLVLDENTASAATTTGVNSVAVAIYENHWRVTHTNY